ncbi:LOW QUALITY PROTEIN: trihelix transcription factor ASIL2-like [Prosopis cineraria]|uniref:LOW QUALITY PROTEIN: trihelix transcription factor ASIL2-like n=1 Tax=Prosopis cineraria TaxID=364024 RepID=UPI00241056C6|nr:LOW QUALITY PROTEIN: trihelix transcription factor ASIL2-like [Prosopis cineraria]
MEADDKIQSPHSPASESPGSPQSNGRITVTVAAPAPSPPQNSLALALPVQHQQPKGNGGGGGGREDCWSEGATAVLIDAWGDRYLELSRGNLKQKHWKEVADIVSSREDYRKTPKTDIQCKNRIDTVKKKYKLEKSKIAAGGGSKWPFYERLDQLIGPTAKISGSAGGSAAGANTANSLSTQKVPLGIPVGIRAVSQNPYQAHQRLQKHQLRMKTPSQKIQLRKRAPVNSDSSPSERESSPVSSDSFPPGTYETKRPRMPRVINSDAVPVETKNKGWGSAIRELTQAILKFGEAYEKAESSKIQQVVEMEKQRMKFAKEMELQRMQFFMKTQLELSQLKRGKRGGGNASNINSNINNHSDSDNLVRLD